MLSCTGAIVAETAAPVVKTKILGLVEMVFTMWQGILDSQLASSSPYQMLFC
jgi:hypothetical protein